MNDIKVIHLNSKNADVITETNDESRLTVLNYYLKKPIILNDDYDVSVSNFSLKKDINNQIIVHDNALSTVVNSSSTREILPTLYNSNVIEETFYNIILYEFDGANFIATSGRATINVTQTLPDITTGQINVYEISAIGDGFTLNNFLYVDKDDLTGTFNSYTNRYGEVKITGLISDIPKTIVNYANVIINPAGSDPINERTYDDMILYESDGAGWYIDSGVRCNVGVALPYVGANFANINILSITTPSSGLSLNQILYIDKNLIIDGEPSMTYNTRFAEYQISEVLNGLDSLVLSSNVEILANERQNNFIGGYVVDNVPVLISDGSSGYITSDATAKMTVIDTPINNNTGRANIMSFTNGGSGFFVGDIIYIDKENLVVDYNTYDPNFRYAQYEVTAITKDDGITISAGNYGLSTYEIGNWYYDIPDKNTRVYIDVIDPPGFSISAYIKKVTGERLNFTLNETFNIQNSQMVNANTGGGGFGKTGIPLQIQINNLTNFVYSAFPYEITLENLSYNHTNYFNSNNKYNPTIISYDPVKGILHHKEVSLTLTKQIISQFTIGINRLIGSDDNLNIILNLKKKNIFN